jgi:(5-formylfuran-3-yl)methyl phosphate synthase
MQLLVSVSSAAEAWAAAEGGADIIDAKDPFAGALGAVRPGVMSRIRRVVDSSRLVTAAVGDAVITANSSKAISTSYDSIERLACELVACGARLVKVGFAGVGDATQVGVIVARLARACGSVDIASGVIAVAYADAPVDQRIDGHRFLSIAADSGARGVLVDTADKHGPGLLELWNIDALAAWVSEAHSYGLMVAVAGKLRLEDLTAVAEAGADVVGVRGAACVGGRGGPVSSERVRALAARVALERSTI